MSSMENTMKLREKKHYDFFLLIRFTRFKVTMSLGGDRLHLITKPL